MSLIFVAGMLLPLMEPLRPAPGQSPTTLTHVFSPNTKFAYQVLSHITAETRGKGLDTWLPSDLDLNYNFYYTVAQMRTDGIAVVHYLRPTMTEVIGETADSPPKDNVENVNFDEMLTVSPINEILEQKNLSAKPPVTHGEKLLIQGPMSFFQPYITDIHRLALFVGNAEDALDFSPKFPLGAVKVGDSWKKTVGFQPQKLKGKVGKVAVQRIDYTYTYVGPMNSDGKPILRVQGKLKFTTDAAEYFKQLLGDHASETDVTKVPIHFDSTVDFDLDPQTRDVTNAQATTQGGFQVFVTELGDTAAIEERFKGRTSMQLTGRRTVSKN